MSIGPSQNLMDQLCLAFFPCKWGIIIVYNCLLSLKALLTSLFLSEIRTSFLKLWQKTEWKKRKKNTKLKIFIIKMLSYESALIPKGFYLDYFVFPKSLFYVNWKWVLLQMFNVWLQTHWLTIMLFILYYGQEMIMHGLQKMYFWVLGYMHTDGLTSFVISVDPVAGQSWSVLWVYLYTFNWNLSRYQNTPKLA